ncbi:MAG: hypothetical protein MUO72_05330 [Bacteroidales bacterium]|nr:hypothetical protein [Bacteroidales bacterium]
MKNKLIIGSVILLMTGFLSCQKNDRFWGESSLEKDLYTSVTEIIGNQVSFITGANEHGVSVERYDGHSPACLLNGSPGNYGIPGWGMPGISHLKFHVPHIDSCVNVTVSSNTYPKEIVIEYLAGCSNHRHDKQGKVIINLSDTITNEGAVQTITYQDFYIDTIKVDLTATLKNLGKNSSGNWVITKTYTQTITKNDEVSVRKNDESQEWTAGFETTDKKDNVYYLSGSGSVVINDAEKYAKTITTPLLFDGSCEFIKSGVIELNRNGNEVIIDYGDGTCDDKATVTTNGTTEEINLHSHKFREGGRFGKHFHGFGRRHGG